MAENKKDKIRPDVVQRDYWRQKDVFADFFNAYLFSGEEKITTDELLESDTDSSTVISIDELDVSIQGARDNLMIAMMQHNVKYAILGIEDFNHIHYATPFKVEKYDVCGSKGQ
jgi:hypothetical protein